MGEAHPIGRARQMAGAAPGIAETGAEELHALAPFDERAGEKPDTESDAESGKRLAPIYDVEHILKVMAAQEVAATAAGKIGVSLAHSLPKRRLEVFFATFLLLVCLRFVVKLAFGV